MATDLLMDQPVTERPVDRLDERILELVEEQGVVGLDALITLVPSHTWNQLFQAVDRLARAGRLTLRRHRFDYAVFSRTYLA